MQWKNSRPRRHEAYCPTAVENAADILTHGVWVLPAATYSYSLVNASQNSCQYWVALAYGAVLILLFSVSTIYHLTKLTGNRILEEIFHRGDRAIIYLFIAGSYTPWLFLRAFPADGYALHLRWAIWLLALLGVIYQQLFHEQYKCLDTIFYVLIGLVPSLAVCEMAEDEGIAELAYGGLCYLVGVVFFKADGHIPFAHAIWHLHVVAGAMIHYHAIATYLIPTSESCGQIR